MVLLTGEEMARLFDLDWQLLADSVLSIVALFVLLFVLSYFLFNPVRKFLASRQERIAGDIRSAEATRTEAEALKAEYEEKLKNVDKETEEILRDARHRALENEHKIIEEAKEEAGRILDHAHKEAELEKQKVADEVKKEMVVLASMIAGKVVTTSIDTTVQDQLVQDALKEIGNSTWQS
jgi:F-type H+-transporting ATPase subunit b